MMSFRGLGDTGLPPRFTVPRLSISAVSCGSSRYSFGRIVCASTLDRSDFKERRDALFLAAIGFPHAKYVASVAPGCVPNDYHPASKQAEADDARFAIVLALVLNFKRGPGKTSAASSKSRPRSASVFARLAGSKVIRIEVTVTTTTTQGNRDLGSP